MAIDLGPRASKVLSAWGDVATAHQAGPGYDLTTPTRSERFRTCLDTFIDDPTELTFHELWAENLLAAASAWHAPTVLNLWPDSMADLAAFFDEIRSADRYDPEWEQRVSWGTVASELYTRVNPDQPIVSRQSQNGLQKIGIEPMTEFESHREQLTSFCDHYLDTVGHVSTAQEEQIPVHEEIDQLFALITTVTDDDIDAEVPGSREELYKALRGYPASSTSDRGPIEIDFEAATPAIDGHITARQNNAYADTETDHWAGSHYETWKWDFAEYVSEVVAPSYPLENLSPDDLEPVFDDFWADADEYTDLSTSVPRYLLGRWGVVQLQDFQGRCLERPDEAATVLSALFFEDEHLVTRLQRFHDFAACEEVSDGNLLRIATTLLMGVYPDEYVNFQYERFDTFFSDCSNIESLNTGFDARQYYRIVLACRDLRDVMRDDLPDASMLDVHTLIRLYQDFK